MFVFFSMIGGWLKRTGVRSLKHPTPTGAPSFGLAVFGVEKYDRASADFTFFSVLHLAHPFPKLSFVKPSVQVGHAWDLTPARARRQAQTVLGPLLRSAKNIGIGLAFAARFDRWLRGFSDRALKLYVRDAAKSVLGDDERTSWKHGEQLAIDSHESVSDFHVGPVENMGDGFIGEVSILQSPNIVHSSDIRPARARRQAQTVLGPLLRSAKNIGIGLAFAGILSAQGTIQLFQVIAPTASANFNNINPRYNAWTVMYNYSGSGTFSIELDCAPDATAAGGTPTAGSFITCTNVITGNNPSTTPKYGYITFLGYTPWLKLVLNSISSGNITVAAFGFNAADPESGSGGGCAGTVATPCIVAGPNATGASPTKNPVFIAGLDGAGNIIPANFPSLNAAISLSSSGLTQILALSGMTVIRVEHISLAFASGVNVQLEYGTGSNCGMGTTAVTGVYEAVTGLALDFDSGTLNIPAGNALCINLGSSVVGGGVIVYSQY